MTTPMGPNIPATPSASGDVTHPLAVTPPAPHRPIPIPGASPKAGFKGFDPKLNRFMHGNTGGRFGAPAAREHARGRHSG